jgi:hypothetical protein
MNIKTSYIAIIALAMLTAACGQRNPAEEVSLGTKTMICYNGGVEIYRANNVKNVFIQNAVSFYESDTGDLVKIREGCVYRIAL